MEPIRNQKEEFLKKTNTAEDQKEPHKKNDPNSYDQPTEGRIKQFLTESSQKITESANYCSKLYSEKKKLIHHYLITGLAMLFIVILFQNIDSSEFKFLFWDLKAPKIVLFIIMLAIGSVLGYLVRGKNKLITE